MASAQTPAYEQFWLREYNSLQSEYKDIVTKCPDADKVLREVYKVMGDIVSLAGCTPANIGTCSEWSRIVDSAKESRIGLCKCLKGKSLFSALYGTNSVTLNDLKSVLQESASEPNSSKASATGPVAMEDSEDGFRVGGNRIIQKNCVKAATRKLLHKLRRQPIFRKRQLQQETISPR
jgi:hypothetical protein